MLMFLDVMPTTEIYLFTQHFSCLIQRNRILCSFYIYDNNANITYKHKRYNNQNKSTTFSKNKKHYKTSETVNLKVKWFNAQCGAGFRKFPNNGFEL